MSDRKSDRTGRSKREPRHVRLYHAMLKSDAWAGLDCVARAAYVQLLDRYGGPGSNNGRIPYSEREMADALNVSRATAHRALEKLVQREFIKQTRKGTFTVKDRQASTWRVMEFMCDVTGDLSRPPWKEKITASPEYPYGQRHEARRATS